MNLRVRTSLLALASLAALTATPALAQTPYDGAWTVTVVTKAGSCESTASYPVMVTDGKVSAGGGEVSGSVASSGYVRVSLGGAFANGQLNGNKGSGKWNSASAGMPCSGRWEAARH